MQRGLRELGKLTQGNTGSSDSSAGGNNSDSGYNSTIQYGINIVSEKLATIIKPRFDVRSDYSILSDLATCPSKNNPAPNNCVIE